MPWMEVKLQPQRDWNEMALDIWVRALQGFLAEKGMRLRPKIRVLPGYQVVSIDGETAPGEIILSASERLVLLEDWCLRGPLDREMAGVVMRVARNTGATALCLPPSAPEAEQFWLSFGAIMHPDPVPLGEQVQP